jgi:hypothetical protein
LHSLEEDSGIFLSSNQLEVSPHFKLRWQQLRANWLSYLLEHFPNERNPFEGIERWLFLDK